MNDHVNPLFSGMFRGFVPLGTAMQMEPPRIDPEKSPSLCPGCGMRLVRLGGCPNCHGGRDGMSDYDHRTEREMPEAQEIEE